MSIFKRKKKERKIIKDARAYIMHRSSVEFGVDATGRHFLVHESGDGFTHPWLLSEEEFNSLIELTERFMPIRETYMAGGTKYYLYR